MEAIGNIIKSVSKSKEESFLHHIAKSILSIWLRDGFERFKDVSKLVIEQKLYTSNEAYIIPDIICFNERGEINYIFEIVHTSEVLGGKISKIQQYKYYKNKSFRVFEISALWIMKQKKKPTDLTYIEII